MENSYSILGCFYNGACAIPVNGVCSTTPGACTTGNATGDNNNNSCGQTRTWTCAGSNSGSDDPCSHSNPACEPPVNGVCGIYNGTKVTSSEMVSPNIWKLCSSAELSYPTITPVSTSYWGQYVKWYWTCAGSNGGTPVTCSANNGLPTIRVVVLPGTSIGYTESYNYSANLRLQNIQIGPWIGLPYEQPVGGKTYYVSDIPNMGILGHDTNIIDVLPFSHKNLIFQLPQVNDGAGTCMKGYLGDTTLMSLASRYYNYNSANIPCYTTNPNALPNQGGKVVCDLDWYILNEEAWWRGLNPDINDIITLEIAGAGSSWGSVPYGVHAEIDNGYCF